MKDEKEMKEVAAAEETADDKDDSMILKFKKPYCFEKKEYTEVDLSGLEEMTANDMIAVNKIMGRTSSGSDIMPEATLEYLCYMAARAAKLPVEFFTGLPCREVVRFKNKMLGFLFGSD